MCADPGELLPAETEMNDTEEGFIQAVRSIDRIPACASCSALHDREWEDHGHGVGKTIDHSPWAWQNAKRCRPCAVAVGEHVVKLVHETKS